MQHHHYDYEWNNDIHGVTLHHNDLADRLHKLDHDHFADFKLNDAPCSDDDCPYRIFDADRVAVHGE